MTLFAEHGPNCTPLVPCKACEIVAWLRSKLSEADFATLVEYANGIAPRPKRTYKRRDRNATESPDPDHVSNPSL